MFILEVLDLAELIGHWLKDSSYSHTNRPKKEKKMKKEKPKFTLVTRDVQFICFFGTSADGACGYAGLNLEWPQKRSKSFSRWLNRTKILLKSLSHHRNRPLLKNSNHVLSG